MRQGLDHASGYFRHAIGARLRMKVTPHLTFEIDRVFEQATRVEEFAEGDCEGAARGGGDGRRRRARTRTARTRTRTRGRGGEERGGRDRRAGRRQTNGADVIRCCPAGAPHAGDAPGRAWRHAGPDGLGGAAHLPRRGHQAGAVSPRRRQGVRDHGVLWRRDGHLRCDRRRHATARYRRPDCRGGRGRAGRVSRADPPGAAAVLGAQAERAGRSTTTRVPARRSSPRPAPW